VASAQIEGSFALDGSEPGAGSVALSPDGALVAAASVDEVVVWDLATGEEVMALHEGASFVRFGPERGQIVTLQGSGVRVWNLEGDLVRESEVPGESLASTITDDGRLVATVDVTELDVTVVDIASGRVLAVIPPDGVAIALAFTTSGASILTGDTVGTVREYACDACLPTEELLDLAGSLAPRALTAEERATYGVG
jgi:WD40 repeat protein